MNSDQTQFIAWYDEFSPRIFKYCFFRVSSKEEAEDITARVFMKTWEYLEAGNIVEYPKTFLYKTANNLVIDFYRTNKASRTFSFDDPEKDIDIPIEADFVEDIDTRQLITDVRKHIEALSEKYQHVVLLRYVDDLSISEIAKVTGLSENNISVRLHRATEKLKTILIKNE